MTIIKATNTKTDKLKWLIYIVLGIGLLTYIIKYSEWHFISKFIFSFPLVINLLFDIYYLKNIKPAITNIEFSESLLIINRENIKSRKIKLSNLKYSIKKWKFDKHKTEIELKEKKGLLFKTSERLHIKNWEEIFKIEKELEKNKVPRVEWKPKTIWRKYWGIFLDLFSMTVTDGDLGMMEYQENLIAENTENPIEKK
ncbi:hypothetical protein [Polaribacter sp. 11A2H]|uniref:hypothetical protein n=1 Tax=Polaribacter sp. 11A2H TaxID=2687290 RepID=UPI00140B4981|nr:hypothetical protein [Polaribacter sp. 11A2H]